MKNLKVLGQTLEEELMGMCDKRVGFALLVFPFNDVPEAGGDYISNAQRSDMIKVLRNTADRLEQKQDIGMPKGEA